MLSTGLEHDKLLEMLQRATPLMISAAAVAVGFKMNLFNIGVQGQYLFGALIGAEVGAQFSAPAAIHVVVILLVAMIGGAAWAAIPAALKVGRNVNEVISTIMLNYVALSLIQWLFDTWFRNKGANGLNVTTKPIPSTGWMPNLIEKRVTNAGVTTVIPQLSGMLVVALLVLFGYWLLVFKSRFGFRLRASGMNPVAARTAGISSKHMIVYAMLISGAVAGLVGMFSVIADKHAYSTQGIPNELGFAGIGVALLGRNHPFGIAVAACLFGFLDATSGALQLEHVPSSIVQMIQAIILLTVVIVNEAVTRQVNRRITSSTARQLDATTAASAAAVPA
jgi:simple sugar transport system permease protein